MTVVKMHQPHLKLYTVPHTLQPMRGTPLTMSGMSIGKAHCETTATRETTRDSNGEDKVRPKNSAMTLYYMQRSHVTTNAEQIALSTLNISGARKLAVHHPAPSTENAVKPAPETPEPNTLTEGSVRAQVLPNGQVRITSTENGFYSLPKETRSRRQRSTISKETSSKPNSSGSEREISGPQVRFSRHLSSSCDDWDVTKDDITKEELINYFQQCDGWKQIERNMVGKCFDSKLSETMGICEIFYFWTNYFIWFNSRPQGKGAHVNRFPQDRFLWSRVRLFMGLTTARTRRMQECFYACLFTKWRLPTLQVLSKWKGSTPR